MTAPITYVNAPETPMTNLETRPRTGMQSDVMRVFAVESGMVKPGDPQLTGTLWERLAEVQR